MRELLDSAAWRVGVAVAAIAIVLGVGFAAWHAASSPSAAEAVAAEAAVAPRRGTLTCLPSVSFPARLGSLLGSASGSRPPAAAMASAMRDPRGSW